MKIKNSHMLKDLRRYILEPEEYMEKGDICQASENVSKKLLNY